MNTRGLIILIALLGAVPAEAARVDGLRIWAGPDKTRAVLDLSGAVEYRLFTLEHPDRVVVDLRSTRLTNALPDPDPNDPLLTAIRSGRRGEDDLRVVFELSEPIVPKSFLLPPAAQYGHRLVVDLYPKVREAAVPQPVKQAGPGDQRDVVVAIDAGHGGEDPGALGPSGVREKDVVLEIARRLKTLLDQRPGMRAVLVRDGDYYIAHKDRPAKAREQRADLFVSVHADAFPDRRVKGSSVFVLSRGRATSEAARYLADRENQADLVGGVSLSDKDETLAAVLLDLSQSASLDASKAVGSKVLAALARTGPTHQAEVGGAPFAVLTAPDIPSILVETAFITNPREEKRLSSETGRNKIATALVYGIEDYFYQNPPPGTWLAGNRTRDSHIVIAGETLSEIALRHGVSLGRLRAVNAIEGDLVRAGDQLRIPAGG